MNVDAWRCNACGELFEEPDGPLYECSRCGGRDVGEGARRCGECHIFAAKVADACCPECQEEDVEEAEAWEGADGKLYASEEAEAAWVAEAPARAEAAEKSRAFTERWLEENRRKSEARNARLLPKLVRLLELLGDRAPRLRRDAVYNLQDIRRDPSCGGTVQAVLEFRELAGLFAPEMREELALAADYSRPWEERRGPEAVVRERIRAALPARFAEALSDSLFCAGSAVCFAMEDAADALLEVLDTPGEI